MDPLTLCLFQFIAIFLLNFPVEINRQAFSIRRNAATASSRVANNAIVGYRNSVRTLAVTPTPVCYARMPRVRRENAVICRHVIHIRRVWCAVAPKENAICRNIVLAYRNSVPVITSNATPICVPMARHAATRVPVARATISANCSGAHRANRRSSATRRTWKAHGTAIVATIAWKRSTSIAPKRTSTAACCSVAIWTSA